MYSSLKMQNIAIHIKTIICDDISLNMFKVMYEKKNYSKVF